MKQKLLLVYLLTHTCHLCLHIHATAHMCAHIHVCACMHTPSDVHTFASSLSELPESRWLLSCNPHAPVKPPVWDPLFPHTSHHHGAWLWFSWGLCLEVGGEGLRHSGPITHRWEGVRTVGPLLKRLCTSSSLITVMLASLALK